VRHSAMLGSARNDMQLTRPQHDHAVAIFDFHAALPDEKQLVRVGMMMPGEHAAKFHKSELLSVQLGNDFRLPLLGDTREFVCQVDAFHWFAAVAGWCPWTILRQAASCPRTFVLQGKNETLTSLGKLRKRMRSQSESPRHNGPHFKKR